MAENVHRYLQERLYCLVTDKIPLPHERCLNPDYNGGPKEKSNKKTNIVIVRARYFVILLVLYSIKHCRLIMNTLIY